MEEDIAKSISNLSEAIKEETMEAEETQKKESPAKEPTPTIPK